jgi:hypothetical protein
MTFLGFPIVAFQTPSRPLIGHSVEFKRLGGVSHPISLDTLTMGVSTRAFIMHVKI